jgi:hypothetical protein
MRKWYNFKSSEAVISGIPEYFFQSLACIQIVLQYPSLDVASASLKPLKYKIRTIRKASGATIRSWREVQL